MEGPDAVALAVTLPDGPLAFGVAVPLVVTLKWDAALVPEPWDDALLAPLAVALRSVERKSVGDAIEETRSYDATPFTLEGIRLDGLRFVAVARDGRGERSATAEAIERSVVGEVDPAAPGALEWPAGFGPVAIEDETPASHGPALATGAAALLVVGAIGFLAWRRARNRRSPRSGASGAVATARARLLALAEEAAAGRTACARVADEARALLADEYHWPALARCREELEALATDAALPAAARTALATLLARADVAKFARGEPTAADAAALRADARALLAALPEKSA